MPTFCLLFEIISNLPPFGNFSCLLCICFRIFAYFCLHFGTDYRFMLICDVCLVFTFNASVPIIRISIFSLQTLPAHYHYFHINSNINISFRSIFTSHSHFY